MGEGRSSISKAKSYKEIGEFWDARDLGDSWEETRSVEFEYDLESEVTYYALEATVAARVNSIASHRGVPAETLLNLWVQEKLQEGA